MHVSVSRRWCGAMLVGLVACGPGSDPDTGDGSGASTMMTAGASSSTTAQGATDTSAGTGADTTAASVATLPDTAEETASDTDAPDPPRPTCVTLGCRNDEWCVVYSDITDTDGAGDSMSAACSPFPARCEGLTDPELLVCLQPLCCIEGDCPKSVEAREKRIYCGSDPGNGCGFCSL